MAKAQVFTYDFLIAIFIITVAVLLSLKIIFNSTNPEDFQILELEAKVLSNELLTEGSPSNWTESNVVLPGILFDGKLNKNKLDMLNNLGYNNATRLFNARKNFFFYFENSTEIINVSNCGFGSTLVARNCQVPVIDAKNIARLNRLAVYENKAVKMVMLTWD